MKMVKGHTLLQKKLKELESELEEVMTLEAETHYDHQFLSEVIIGRFTFLKGLLSAETQSHTQKPHHLHHIAQRLEELESVFKNWDSFGASSFDHIETASTCSCTESCFNDDDDQVEVEDDGGGGSPDLDVHHYQDPGIAFEGVIQEQQTVATVKAEGCEERKERRVWFGNKVSAVMSGVVMLTVAVMGVGMAGFCGSCCYKTGLDGFLIPPT